MNNLFDYQQKSPEKCKIIRSSLPQAKNEVLTIFQLETAFIFGNPPLLVIQPGTPPLEESVNYNHLEKAIQKNLHSAVTIESVIYDCAFLANWWCDGFFHWMLECLPRIAHLEQIGFTGKYIVPHLHEFVVSSAESLGVAPDRLIVYRKPVVAKNIYIFQRFPGRFLQDYPVTLHHIREKFLKNVTSNNNHLRIYNHRPTTRKVKNEQEVFAVLKKFSFDIIDMAALPLKEQIRIAANAEIMVGAHGAGMIHSWFMPHASFVVEFFSNKYVNYTLLPFIQHLSLRYIPLPESLNGPQPEPLCNGFSTLHNITVDTKVLELTLKNFLDRN